MKNFGTKVAVNLMAGTLLLVCGSSLLADKDNPYGSIIKRNAFGLTDPPPPKVAPVKTEPPPPAASVRLAGITTMFSQAQAFFEIVPKPGEKAVKPVLEVGEAEGDIKLLAINVDSNMVTIENAGVVTNLFIEARKAPPAPPKHAVAGIRPGVPRLPGKQPTSPKTAAGSSVSRSGNVAVSGPTATVPTAPSALAGRTVVPSQPSTLRTPVAGSRFLGRSRTPFYQGRSAGRVAPTQISPQTSSSSSVGVVVPSRTPRTDSTKDPNFDVIQGIGMLDAEMNGGPPVPFAVPE